jgi:hypothetical protein
MTFRTKNRWSYKTGDLLKEVKFIWNFTMTGQEKVTFKYRWLLNIGLTIYDWFKIILQYFWRSLPPPPPQITVKCYGEYASLTYSSEYIAFANKQTRLYFCLDNLIIAIWYFIWIKKTVMFVQGPTIYLLKNFFFFKAI